MGLTAVAQGGNGQLEALMVAGARHECVYWCHTWHRFYGHVLPSYLACLALRSFTLEASFAGASQGRWARQHFSTMHLEQQVGARAGGWRSR